MSATGQRAEAHPSFRFAVRLDNIPHATFTECTLPSLEVDIHEQKEGGYNTGVHLLPGRIKAGRLTLKGGLTQSNEMMKWYQNVASGNVEAAKQNVDVVMFDAKGQPILNLTFEQAYPVKWSGPTLNAGQNAIAIETLELAFSEVTVE